MAPRKRKARAVRKTILIVTEGHVEYAFLSLLKEYYSVKEYKINLDNRRGGGPEIIINHAINEKLSHACVTVFLDGDVKIPDAVLRRAKNEKIDIIINTPCIESTLLRILEQPCYDTTPQCKGKFEEVAGTKKTTSKEVHRRLFPKEIIESKKAGVNELEKIVNIISGNIGKNQGSS
ncbi:hypothetical protein OW493_14645 [Cobetia sp. 14N.309.X.WAT.E.A4]|uniref:hypothetical protein n=1 Tax=Cobetia sp. 14N.309.X.WAT.E.A4 TaxID=2998323 RepID=UPI0025B22BD5|nr:hypothetical protein [Cobetia sp. 14N.309.X.WAT.E.A4]MDN2657682.1 hypothetical protein [Cobetia sp. 14N.309.X.WAT.E.A4]